MPIKLTAAVSLSFTQALDYFFASDDDLHLFCFVCSHSIYCAFTVPIIKLK